MASYDPRPIYQNIINTWQSWLASGDSELFAKAQELERRITEVLSDKDLNGQQWYNLNPNKSAPIYLNAVKLMEPILNDISNRPANKAAEDAKIEAQKTQARESRIAEREAAAKAAQVQARSQGVNRGLAASLGNAPLAGYSAENYQNNYSNLASLGQSTQNDWLQKMGYVKGLEQTANNMEKGGDLVKTAAWMGGAADGFSSGWSIGG